MPLGRCWGHVPDQAVVDDRFGGWPTQWMTECNLEFLWGDGPGFPHMTRRTAEQVKPVFSTKMEVASLGLCSFELYLGIGESWIVTAGYFGWFSVPRFLDPNGT